MRIYFIPISLMSNYDAQYRIFSELRMHPWIPEHKVFIDGGLAKLTVVNPGLGKQLAAQYVEKMKNYVPPVPELAVDRVGMSAPKPVPPSVEAPQELPVEVPDAPKKKKKKSLLPPL